MSPNQGTSVSRRLFSRSRITIFTPTPKKPTQEKAKKATRSVPASVYTPPESKYFNYFHAFLTYSVLSENISSVLQRAQDALNLYQETGDFVDEVEVCQTFLDSIFDTR